MTLLYLTWSLLQLAPGGLEPDCARGSQEDRIRCQLAQRFSGHPKAQQQALQIYKTARWIVETEEPYLMDGGWRGTIKIIPKLPVKAHRQHLLWLLSSANEFALFFNKIKSSAKSDFGYRWRDITFKFFQSVKRRTPSAYAINWSIGYNVSGSLLRSAPSVRNTLFHEIFHLNDAEHGDWSKHHLEEIYQEVITQCSQSGALGDSCLKKFAPSKTKVKGSTYYAFHPGEGVEEYAAELAERYFLDNRRIIDGKKVRRPFKCRHPLNQKAWDLLVLEFFGGVDLVPSCGN